MEFTKLVRNLFERGRLQSSEEREFFCQVYARMLESRHQKSCNRLAAEQRQSLALEELRCDMDRIFKILSYGQGLAAA